MERIMGSLYAYTEAFGHHQRDGAWAIPGLMQTSPGGDAKRLGIKTKVVRRFEGTTFKGTTLKTD